MSEVQKTETAAELLAKISPRTLELSLQLKEGLTVDAEKETGVISAETYAAILPEGLTVEMAEKFREFHGELYPALGHLAGEVGVPLMVANPEMKRLVLEMPTVGKDRINVSFDRERTYADNQTKGTLVKHGQVLVQHHVYGTKNRGEVAKVKNFLSQLAHEALAGKK